MAEFSFVPGAFVGPGLQLNTPPPSLDYQAPPPPPPSLDYQAPPPATASSGSVTPEMFAAWMKTQGYGKQDDPSPLQMLRGQQDPRAAAAAQMYGGGAGNISFAGKPGLIPPDIAQLIDIGAKIAPFV